jgi:hypothetical protein
MRMQGKRYGISLHLGQPGIVKAYINGIPLPGSRNIVARERETLACLLVNALGDSGEALAVIPLDLSQLEADDPRNVLKGTEVSVYLELGIYSPALGKRLVDGLEAFYAG